MGMYIQMRILFAIPYKSFDLIFANHISQFQKYHLFLADYTG